MMDDEQISVRLDSPLNGVKGCIYGDGTSPDRTGMLNLDSIECAWIVGDLSRAQERVEMPGYLLERHDGARHDVRYLPAPGGVKRPARSSARTESTVFSVPAGICDCSDGLRTRVTT